MSKEVIYTCDVCGNRGTVASTKKELLYVTGMLLELSIDWFPRTEDDPVTIIRHVCGTCMEAIPYQRSFSMSEETNTPMSKRTDSERLDALQSLLGRHTGKVICRWSVWGRGWRLHECDAQGGVSSVREAIDRFLETNEDS